MAKYKLTHIHKQVVLQAMAAAAAGQEGTHPQPQHPRRQHSREQRRMRVRPGPSFRRAPPPAQQLLQPFPKPARGLGNFPTFHTAASASLAHSGSLLHSLDSSALLPEPGPSLRSSLLQPSSALRAAAAAAAVDEGEAQSALFTVGASPGEAGDGAGGDEYGRPGGPDPAQEAHGTCPPLHPSPDSRLPRDAILQKPNAAEGPTRRGSRCADGRVHVRHDTHVFVLVHACACVCAQAYACCVPVHRRAYVGMCTHKHIYMCLCVNEHVIGLRDLSSSVSPV